MGGYIWLWATASITPPAFVFILLVCICILSILLVYMCTLLFFDRNTSGKELNENDTGMLNKGLQRLIRRCGAHQLSKWTDDDFGRTLLHMAVGDKDLVVVRYFTGLDDSTLIMAKDDDGKTALHYAVESDYVEIAQVLVEAGGVNLLRAADSDGKTALFYVRSPAMIELLCKAGGEELVNAKARDGKTALHAAIAGPEDAIAGQADGNLCLLVVRCLVECGACVFEKDDLGWTPLHTASTWGMTGAAEYLAKKGGSDLVEAFNNKGMTALHLAVFEVHESVYDNRLDVIKCLVESCKANILAADADGRTALHISVADHDDEVSLYLVEHGGSALVSAANARGMTALHYAPNIDVARVMVDVAGSELVFAQDCDGRTALHCAAASRFNDREFVEFLIGIGGADLINVATARDGKTAFHQYAAKNDCDMLRFMFDTGGVNVDVADAAGCTALHHTSSSGGVESATFLVQDCGAHMDAMDSDGCTPLLRACASIATSVAMVQHLETLGANINAIDSHGRSALHHACSSGSFAVVEYWIATHGHHVNVADHGGWTALHHASSSTSAESLAKTRLLLAAGADPHAVATETGITPLHLASANRKLHVILLLMKRFPEN